MPHITTFGRWLSVRRHLLDLTQDELAQRVGCAVVLNESSGSVPEPFERAYLERTTAAARAQLGEAAFASAWAAGRDMTLEQAIVYALESSEF